MQLIAVDETGRPVKADDAHRQSRYACPECGRPLTLRGGLRYRKHFYHSCGRGECRQAGKSATHLHIQEWIANELPKNEALLEHRLDTVGRIADVYWPSQKLVFEVQCSSITAQEVRARNRDYGSLGLTVVWILHQTRFRHRTQAEAVLRNQPVYYTAMGPQGQGLIFDQIVRGAPKLPIAINQPLGKPVLPLGPWHPMLSKRTLHFVGDACDAACGPQPPAFLRQANRIRSLKKFLKRLKFAINGRGHR